MFDVFNIDPPWPKRKGGKRASRPNQGRELAYPTMPVPDIYSLLDREIFSQATPQHTVFLWSIDQFLHESEREMTHRGYRLHARLVWDKCNGVAPCFTIRYAHEYLLWFYKPKLTPVAGPARGKFTTVIRSPAREHSRKPDEAYSLIDSLFPAAAKLDVFSREPRAGWSQYGNQTSHFQERPAKADVHP